MFKDVKIKKYELSDLVGRNLNIRTFTDDGLQLITAIDTSSGELFVIKEQIIPVKLKD